MEKPPPPLRLNLDNIDERWLGEWIAFGMRELHAYLAHHAAFDEYLTTHDRKEPSP